MGATRPGPLRTAGLLLLNLVLPGGGLILAGAAALGVIVGLIFAAFANLAVLASLLFPDDFSPNARALWIGFAGGAYVAAQLRLAQTLREREAAARAEQRRAALQAVRAHLAANEPAAALAALEPLARAEPDDLLVNVRLAQIHTAAGDRAAARSAWLRVRTLDRERIYWEHVREQLGL